MYGHAPIISTEDTNKAVVSKSFESKFFRRSANAVQNLAIWSSTSAKWLKTTLSGRPSIKPLLCFKEHITYFQSCVVYTFQWNARIQSFSSIFLPWCLEEHNCSSVRLRKPRTSRPSPSLWRDLESSHLELVVLAPSDRIDAYEEKEQNNRVNSPSFRQKVPATRHWHKDGSFEKNDQFRWSNEEDTQERTFATSSAILINGSNFFIRELNDVTSFCWFDRVSEILVKTSDTSETMGCKSFWADVLVWSSASPATADAESCVIRTDSLAGLGFPFLSTKDRTTPILSSFQHWYHQRTVGCYSHSFGCEYWSWSRCPSSMSILPRHLSPKRLSCDTVMVSFDELSRKGLRNVT